MGVPCKPGFTVLVTMLETSKSIKFFSLTNNEVRTNHRDLYKLVTFLTKFYGYCHVLYLLHNSSMKYLKHTVASFTCPDFEYADWSLFLLLTLENWSPSDNS